ncbi:MAG: heme o synthase [Oscillochloridaceae bacterium]|nr:heme o synthase [Chloroflexaceae bacterium]MDW8389904.1 heme o synthase [Oscillochloridaceae bacterium]
MPHITVRRLTLIGATATLLAIASGGLVTATTSGAACPGWPLCADGVAWSAGPAVWIAVGHRVAVLLAALLALWGAVLAWRARELETRVRLPLLLAPLLGMLQVGLGALIVQWRLFSAADVWHLALALLVLACQVVPLAVLAQPRAETGRLGARAVREARRLRGLAWWTAGAVGVLTVALSARAATPGASAAALLPANAFGALAIAGALASGTFWQTWRTRRGDRLLLGMAALLAALIAAESLVLVLPPAAAGFGVGLGAVVWSLALALAVLAERRPAPVAALAARVEARRERTSLISDYLSLTKPRVISLLLVTTLAAMYITEAGAPSLWLVFWTMVGGYLAAGGAGAINCAFDGDIDVNMGRTSRRPVPSGRITPRNAFIFGLALSLLAVAVLLVFTTPLAALFASLGIVYYALFYTRWLKRSTWQNIIIGGGAGAIPPLVGWTAVAGNLSLAAVVLFAIIFYWTPPHFWALALVKQKDYARAGVPMLPVVAGEVETRWQILVYSTLMVALSGLLTAIGAMGWVYFAAAALLGAVFLRYAWLVWRRGDQASIWGLYKYSLLYLALLFAAMALDRAIL